MASSGQAQESTQWAITLQAAQSQAKAAQEATNSNAPVNVASGDVSGGSNSADQTPSNEANSAPAVNSASTTQDNSQTQDAGSSTCTSGCGGNGQAQQSTQGSITAQYANSAAEATQDAVNANAPVNVAGGSITSGSNSASQTATNNASSAPAVNNASTTQDNNQSPNGGSSSCSVGCGGNGQAQLSSQLSLTLQKAVSQASAKQNAVNANVPVNIAGGTITSGSNSADQTVTNGATSGPAVNNASTTQGNSQTQNAGSSSCAIGCGGNGQAQLSFQGALTAQYANSSADANQNAVNANVPVNIAGGSITGGDNSAD